MAAGLAAGVVFLGLPVSAFADTTVNFDGYGDGTTITSQYANLGGNGKGVVFGPLPGGDSGLNPVVRAEPAGQPHSAPNVADIDSCGACEFAPPSTTGTFAVPRTHVRVYVGLPGAPTTCSTAVDPGCATIKLTAVDANGQPVAATAPTQVHAGGAHTLLSVSTATATIVGFKIASTDSNDNGKQVLIDDLSFDTPVAPPTPDFTLTPASTNVNVVQGSARTDAVAIGRIGGSTGNVNMAVSGTLPTGVHAQINPNPAATSTTLKLTADPTAPPTLGIPRTITITGTPTGPGVGPSPRTFHVTVGVKQAFDVRVEGSRNIGLASCAVTVPVQVIRDPGFPGPVSLSISGLPPGVTGTFVPGSATFPNNAFAESISLNLVAPATGQAVLARTATIHAKAPPLHERTTTITVGGACPMKYDPEIKSMQITQGTQLPVLPTRDAAFPGNPIPYNSIGQAASPGSMQELAKLAYSKTTVVRVYAGLRYGPDAGVQVPAVLNGWRYDNRGRLNPLAGGPILPITNPDRLYPGLDRFDDSFFQANYYGVYTFVLPSSWTQGKIKLQAQLLTPQSVPPGALPPIATTQGPIQSANAAAEPTWAPCTDAGCQVDGKFAISEIQFYYTFDFGIRPVQMIVTNPMDHRLPDPSEVFKWAQVVTPIQLNIEPYTGTIDISDEIGRDNSTGAATIGMLHKLLDDICNNGSPAHGALVGVEHNDIRTAQATGTCWEGLPIPQQTRYNFAFVNSPWTLRSTGHELFHVFGRPHASAGCGAAIGLNPADTQPAESWPPDQMGYLQSYGLAPAPSGYPYPYEPILSLGGANQWYDFMSYCPPGSVFAGGPLDPHQNAWVSVHNWNQILNIFGYTGARDLARARSRATPKARPAATRVNALQVTASVSPGGQTTIVDVHPLEAPPQSARNSPYHLIGTNAAGHTVADVPMLTSFSHVDARPPVPVLTLGAVIPAAGVQSVSITSSGSTVATRHASAHAPTVKIPRLPRFRGPNAVLHWRAADADHDPLVIDVSYSGDGGRTWRGVWMGPNRGNADVPARYLYRTVKAQVRVAVNDGFHTTTVISSRFASRGAPPSVHILTPWPHLRQPNDAPLLLSGQAFDDRPVLLNGRRLTWKLGRHRLGTGRRITVSGLPAGKHQIDLIARDRFGRIGRASIVVSLRAAKPLFLTLKAPRKLGRKARSLRLTVASSLPATLQVRLAGRRLQRFGVGRRVKRLTVHVAWGRGPLLLRLSLRAGGKTRKLVLAVPRPPAKKH